jgi:ferredoxin-NADP reductase
MIKNSREFILVDKKNEAENITSLFFKPADGLSFNFIAGQYVSVTLSSISSPPKCYSISSAPSEKLIRLTVKMQGEFSSALIDSKIGDKLVFDGPYGKFYPEGNSNNLVFIAGGIGITPLFSIIKDKSIQKTRPKITLLYSNKTISGIAFFDELNELKENNAIDNLVYFVTQENPPMNSESSGQIKEYSRINKDLLKKYLVSFEDKDYYICGPMQFMDAIRKDLKESGVSEENIFTETF